MRKAIYILALFLSVGAAWAATSIRLSLDRDRIYLGESVIASVSVEGSRNDKERPAFENLDESVLEFLGSRDNSRSSIMIVNGKVTKESYEGRVFAFRITPSEAGSIDTGRVTLKSGGHIVTAPGATIRVTGVEKREDIFASLGCADTTVLVDGGFTIDLTVSIQALPAPYADIEPIMPDKPLHIEADFLNGAETKGLKLPDIESILNNLVSKRREPTFTINQFAMRGMSMGLFDFDGDPFAARPINFRLPRKKVKHGDKDYWEYSISLGYIPTAEGDYTFGPLTVKGSFISGVGDGDTAVMSEVFVIGPAVTVRVVPPPEEGRPDWFIGSVGKSMKATASFDTSYCKVGDPLTLTLDLTGDISLSNMKPPLLSLQQEDSDDFRIYDDNIESDGIDGGKRFKYRVRPLRAGTLEFPPIRAAYFNTTNSSYVTVATPPMPLQAEATTQISAIPASGESPNGTEDESVADSLSTPDGILVALADPLPRTLRFGARKLACALWCLTLLWPLAVLLKALVRRLVVRRKNGGLKNRAHKNSRILAKALSLAGNDPVAAAAMASGAARVSIAARLGKDTASMTETEMRDEMTKRSVPAETIDEICAAFSTLERLSYARGAANGDEARNAISRLSNAMTRMSAALKALIAAAVLSAFATESASARTVPDEFRWEQANQVMSTAVSQEDFANAAQMYYSMVTNGASSGALYYNLATALLLTDGGKDAAMEALVAAERHLGTTAEIATDMRLALSTDTSRGQLPVSRIFLVWHYGLPFATRFDMAVTSFAALMISLPLIVICGERIPFLRRLLKTLAALSLLLAVIYAGSAFLSHMQDKHADLPRVASFLNQIGGAQ